MSNLGKFENLSSNFSTSFKDFASDKKINKSEIEKLEKIENKTPDDIKLLELLKSNDKNVTVNINDNKYKIDLKDNVDKKEYSKGKVPPTIFKSENEKGKAEKYLDLISGNAFDPLRSTEDKFLNLKSINEDALKGSISKLEIDKTVPAIPLNTLKDVKTNEDFVNAIKDYISKNPKVLQELGTKNPTDEQITQYILNNLDSIAQNLGDDIPYDGFTSLIGDSNGFLTLEQGYGVCTDIHATVTALRKAFGQEAYLVMTSGSDAAHVFTIFKKEGKWHIQNYDSVYKTSANTVSELYDQVMPEQRKIKMYDVEADGNIKQKITDHLTATGLSERRFRSESGSGSFNPWTSPEGLTLGSGELSYAKNGFYIGINPNDNTIRGAYYKKTQEGDTQKVQGASVQGQYFENKYGYEQKKVDIKYDVEKKYDNADEKKFGRSHFSVHTGVEATPEPIYWSNLSDGGTSVSSDDTAVRVGVSYSRNDSKLYGDNKVKFELGHQTKLAGTITFSAKDPLDPAYVGRMYSDLTAESKMVTGAFIQPNKDLTIRTGLASGVDLAKIDGFKQAGEQIKNVVESDAYLDVRYSKDKVALNTMAIVPLHDPTQYKIGGGIAIVPTDKLVIGATYIHEKILNDNVDKVRVGMEFSPVQNVTLGANVSTPLIGDNAKDTKGEAYLRVKF